MSGDPIANNPNAAGFHNTAIIDDVSALSFTNMAFWGGLEDIGVSMNSLRTVNISVNNFENLGDSTLVTEVPSEYSLIFELPENFADKLAIQLIDGDDKVLTPQMVLYEMIRSVNPSKPTAVYKTQDPQYNGKPYVGQTHSGNTVSFITFDVSLDTDSGVYTMTSQDKDETVITVEPIIKEDLLQTLYFRLWDVADVEKNEEGNVELESGTLLPPLIFTFSEDVPYYRITVNHKDFDLGSGSMETDRYKMTLAPIDALRDTHLGGYLMNLDSNGEFVHARSIKAGDKLYLSTVTEVVTSHDGSDDKVTLMGSIPIHTVGKTETKDIGTNTREITYNDVYTVTDTKTTSTTDNAHTKYYTYRTSNRRWSNSNSTNGLYRIRNFLTTTTTTTTYYDIRVREISKITEEILTNSVSEDKTHVEQTVIRKSANTVLLLDAIKRTDTQITYTESYEYAQRNSTGNTPWTVVNSFNYTFTGSYPTSYEMENPPIVEGDDVPLTADEIEELKTWDAIAPYLQGDVTQTSFDREKNYTATHQTITPLTIYTADDTIPLDPLHTHITTPGGTEQKYFISTSYSKNYSCYMKVHFEQVIQPITAENINSAAIILKKEAINEEDIK